jgi:hypothetical protein
MPSNITQVAGATQIDLYLGNYAYSDIAASMAALKIKLATDLDRLVYKNAAGTPFKVATNTDITAGITAAISGTAGQIGMIGEGGASVVGATINALETTATVFLTAVGGAIKSRTAAETLSDITNGVNFLLGAGYVGNIPVFYDGGHSTSIPGEVRDQQPSIISQSGGDTITIDGDLIADDLSGLSLILRGSSSGQVSFSAQAAAGAISYIWPNADGSNDYVLTTDGSGNLFWSDKSGGTPGSITSLNGSSSSAQTLAGSTSIGVAESGTGNAVHTITLLSHAHAWSDITSGVPELGSAAFADTGDFAAASHAHAWSDITSGVPSFLLGNSLTDTYLTKFDSETGKLVNAGVKEASGDVTIPGLAGHAGYYVKVDADGKLVIAAS